MNLPGQANILQGSNSYILKGLCLLRDVAVSPLFAGRYSFSASTGCVISEKICRWLTCDEHLSKVMNIVYEVQLLHSFDNGFCLVVRKYR